jgi:hypothetical protein
MEIPFSNEKLSRKGILLRDFVVLLLNVIFAIGFDSALFYFVSGAVFTWVCIDICKVI